MKKNILTMIFFILASQLVAQSSSFLLKEGNAKYTAEEYNEAISLYESGLEKGESASLYYNLGNAYYKSGNLGKAILNYERAYLLKPGEEDIRYNLELARSQTIDQIKPIDRFFLTEWIDGISYIWNTNTWAYISIVCFIVTLLLAGVYIFTKTGWLKKTSFFTGIFILLISIISFSFSKKQRNILLSHEYAIVLSPTVTVKGSPDESGTALFVVHEGTKVKIKQTLNQWIEIQLADGNIGWIEVTNLETI
jgi:tetratricopeptide (TPR) repeat protein